MKPAALLTTITIGWMLSVGGTVFAQVEKAHIAISGMT